MARAQSACLHCDAVCDTVKPRPDSILRPHVGGPSSEDEEDRLEGILSILSVPQKPVTHTKYKWPVTIDKIPECRLAPAEIRGEQLSIGFARGIRNQTSQATEAQIHPLPYPLLPSDSLLYYNCLQNGVRVPHTDLSQMNTAGLRAPDHYGAAAWHLVSAKQKLRERAFDTEYLRFAR
jgi:hypothetical protein